ncbi:Retrovirus-related pol polyprotein from transposon tnt 1-94 [Abeliophyllum distichum]|uniref:Retrovirus-related pol polyprotein from transposon tnt 1-94 n=1 Tax=Abeliophyllum distichum TaxID=126358 RepID=A0ABD1PS18_9LAMI
MVKMAGNHMFTLETQTASDEQVCCLSTMKDSTWLWYYRRQFTAAYSPHQNGVSKRKNRTIMNMVRSMMSKKKVSKDFWSEAINWSVHVLNRSPTFIVKNVTPHEAWSRNTPVVSYFKIFGSIYYARVLDEKKKKLDDKGVKFVLLGISEESKAYKLYNTLTKKIIISQDVVFDEDSCWDGNGINESVVDLEKNGDEEPQQEKQQVDDSTSTTSSDTNEVLETPVYILPHQRNHVKEEDQTG